MSQVQNGKKQFFINRQQVTCLIKGSCGCKKFKQVQGETGQRRKCPYIERETEQALVTR